MAIHKQLLHEMKAPAEILEEAAAANTYVKHYPAFYRRNDVQDDFVSISRFLRMMLPEAKLLSQHVGPNISTMRFDVSQSKEVVLEQLLAKHGYVKYRKTK
jgi:hypothetical protein